MEGESIVEAKHTMAPWLFSCQTFPTPIRSLAHNETPEMVATGDFENEQTPSCKDRQTADDGFIHTCRNVELPEAIVTIVCQFFRSHIIKPS